MPAIDAKFEPHLTFRYMVQIDNVNSAVFTECKLPSFQIETLEIKEGGQNNFTHQLPIRVKAGSITLKNGISKDDELLKWYLDVLKALSSGALKDVVRNVNITMLSVNHEPVSVFSLVDAYPKKWAGPNLKSDDRAVAIEELELAFTSFATE